MASHSDTENLSFQLPPKYAPGTDLMNKWILNHELVINLIIKSVIGEHAENEYSTKPIEWTNYTRSDVFYCPNNRAKTKTLPPVLIEVQYAANGAFFRRLIEYCLMIRKQHPILPVVVVFCIHNTSQEFKDLTYDCKELPFSKRVYCHGWARDCYFISESTISAYLDQQPLHPLAALGHFFTEQKLSILGTVKKEDPTIKLLYEIAKRIFENEAANEDARQDALNLICNKASAQFKLAVMS
ncbi:uncharacterized protein BX663DRAFT_431337 [Cokeromyces recurvatus]|uniref:uncharacterized protein n=1 Tax=Cokeromyces recurvatus TaxID=90255 RepID=UPI00221F2C48|nr:uncharacterized protein BX663DRAFT_431337 [Cokeromyces recurvatus]KAI7904806.1 hypothetical protein BX663DRAFT_431337 [Cokeromyces recurvatus]